MHISYDIIVEEKDQPIRMLTKLGWDLLCEKADKGQTNVTLNHVKTDNLQKLFQTCWKIEGSATLPKANIQLLPKKDADAMKILQTTTLKVRNRYLLGLFLKVKSILRMVLLVKKFPALKEKCVQTINEFIKDGYASILSKAEVDKESTKILNCIPHQVVTRVNKPCKVRVIFDARARCKNTSPNENLQKGPDLLNNILWILLPFRNGRYCVTADIKKMFQQVLVRKQDRETLRFV